MDAARTLFCFGLGYSALHFVEGLLAQGWRVLGTCRSEEKRQALAARGIEVARFDGSAPVTGFRERCQAAGVSAVLSSVPPDEQGDAVLQHHRQDLVALSEQLAWVGYLSSTGVYGDHGGAWVDETAETRPASARARRRLAAERGWRTLTDDGLAVHVFRLAGIYGPGRSALDRVRSGRARRIRAPGKKFSRIHVVDIARVLAASLARPSSAQGAIYNVADDEPREGDQVVALAAELLNVEPPPVVELDDPSLGPWVLGFYADHKLVKNQRIKDELGVKLAYPTVEAGLRALRAAEAEPNQGQAED